MTDIENTSATKSFTVQGVNVNVKIPYAAGQTIDEAEASTLNQTYLENIRNNTASKVKKAIKEWLELGAKDMPEGEANPNTEENFAPSEELVKEIQAYADSYKFGIKRLSNLEPADPVEKEARKIARDQLNSALKTAGHKLKDIADDKYEAMLNMVAAKPDVVKEAKRRVAVAQTIGNAELDLAGLLAAASPDQQASEQTSQASGEAEQQGEQQGEQASA